MNETECAFLRQLLWEKRKFNVNSGVLVWLFQSYQPAPDFSISWKILGVISVVIEIDGGDCLASAPPIRSRTTLSGWPWGTVLILPADARPGQGIHHPRFGEVLKARLDPLKIECILHHASEYSAQDDRNIAMCRDLTAFLMREFRLLDNGRAYKPFRPSK